MSELQRLVRIHYQGVNSGDFDMAGSVFAADCETVSPYGTLTGIAAIRQMGEAFSAAAPDNRIEALRTWEDGDTVIVEGVYTGTHTGPLAGPGGVIPATGRSFTLPYVDIFRAQDGKLVSHRVYWDNAMFLAQLGVLPAPAGAGA
jgi:steroid delta-isomerase-like uncharacterized protein